MKTEYKFLNQTSFFFFMMGPTENENKKHYFFQLTKHALMNLAHFEILNLERNSCPRNHWLRQ